MTADGFSWPDSRSGAYLRTAMVVHPSSVHTYICTACGYFEHYVADPGKLAEVAQSWPAVSP
jgi:hypothetical protein